MEPHFRPRGSPQRSCQPAELPGAGITHLPSGKWILAMYPIIYQVSYSISNRQPLNFVYLIPSAILSMVLVFESPAYSFRSLTQ